MAFTSINFSNKALVIITGASQGIGQTIAVEVAKRLVNHSIIVLLARSESRLNETKKLVGDINKTINVQAVPLDLSIAKLEDYELLFHTLKLDDIKLSVIFHNAGHVGVLDKGVTLTDIDVWRNYYDLNLFSVVALNSVFIKKLRDISAQIVVVNISSKCGLVPFKNMAMYGSAKAARNLFFKVLAAEEPNINVLNYCPGPVDTEMFADVIENMKDAETRSDFVNLKESKTILTSTQTVCKLLRILETSESYISGDSIDYYDQI